MKYLDKYPNCIGCPVKKWCGTMISCIRLCKSYRENKEEKQLLLKDLCARLPYGVKLRYVEDLVVKKESHIITLNNIYLEHILNGDADIKPYLRPMSSMTEEEKKMLWEELDKDMDILETNIGAPIISVYKGRCYSGNPVHNEIDFLNKNHFDWRGLIPMGLALEAPDGMYNNKTE